MVKRQLSSWLRKKGFLKPVDDLYFFVTKVRNYSSNRRFREEHPGVPLPDDYSLFETYRLNYSHYYYDGERTAANIMGLLGAFTSFPGKKILEWGCGPARIVRHLPSLLPETSLYACDYNQETVDWCRQHIQGVQFSKNALTPPLPYEAGFFDMVYAVSVFTHLSKDNHFSWMEEIHRVVKPGGYFLLSTQGESFLPRLTAAEKARFREGQLVERSHTVEGHRLFSSFQPPLFMRLIFSTEWEIKKFIPGSSREGPQQDFWIIQKRWDVSGALNLPKGPA